MMVGRTALPCLCLLLLSHSSFFEQVSGTEDKPKIPGIDKTGNKDATRRDSSLPDLKGPSLTNVGEQKDGNEHIPLEKPSKVSAQKPKDAVDHDEGKHKSVHHESKDSPKHEKSKESSHKELIKILEKIGTDLETCCEKAVEDKTKHSHTGKDGDHKHGKTHQSGHKQGDDHDREYDHKGGQQHERDHRRDHERDHPRKSKDSITYQEHQKPQTTHHIHHHLHHIIDGPKADGKSHQEYDQRPVSTKTESTQTDAHHELGQPRTIHHVHHHRHSFEGAQDNKKSSRPEHYYEITAAVADAHHQERRRGSSEKLDIKHEYDQHHRQGLNVPLDDRMAHEPHIIHDSKSYSNEPGRQSTLDYSHGTRRDASHRAHEHEWTPSTDAHYHHGFVGYSGERIPEESYPQHPHGHDAYPQKGLNKQETPYHTPNNRGDSPFSNSHNHPIAQVHHYHHIPEPLNKQAPEYLNTHTNFNNPTLITHVHEPFRNEPSTKPPNHFIQNQVTNTPHEAIQPHDTIGNRNQPDFPNVQPIHGGHPGIAGAVFTPYIDQSRTFQQVLIPQEESNPPKQHSNPQITHVCHHHTHSVRVDPPASEPYCENQFNRPQTQPIQPISYSQVDNTQNCPPPPLVPFDPYYLCPPQNPLNPPFDPKYSCAPQNPPPPPFDPNSCCQPQNPPSPPPPFDSKPCCQPQNHSPPPPQFDTKPCCQAQNPSPPVCNVYQQPEPPRTCCQEQPVPPCFEKPSAPCEVAPRERCNCQNPPPLTQVEATPVYTLYLQKMIEYPPARSSDPCEAITAAPHFNQCGPPPLQRNHQFPC